MGLYIFAPEALSCNGEVAVGASEGAASERFASEASVSNMLAAVVEVDLFLDETAAVASDRAASERAASEMVVLEALRAEAFDILAFAAAALVMVAEVEFLVAGMVLFGFSNEEEVDKMRRDR